MAKSFLNEAELKEFREIIQATCEMGEKYGAKLADHANVAQYNPLDVTLALYIGRLDTSSRRLNCLTWALIVLTAVLTILTAILSWSSFN